MYSIMALTGHNSEPPPDPALLSWEGGKGAAQEADCYGAQTRT